MTVWGIGGKWALGSILLSLPIMLAAFLFHDSLVMTSVPPWCFYTLAALLILIGFPFLLWSAITLVKGFNAEELCTSGVFALCRNPIYAAWILFLAPGILLFFRAPILLAIPVIMYIVLRSLLYKEEQWLEEKYGEAYREYKRRVHRLLPASPHKLFLSRHANSNRHDK